MILVRVPHKKSGMLSLLKGQIRSKINPPKSKVERRNKLYVKTKSVAIGIRGTEFHTIYNPKTDATTLLTYKGNVAMVKLEDSHNKNTGNSRVKDEEIVSQKVQEIKNKLDAKEAVEVKNGQYSGTNQIMEKASLPIKISPIQLTVLYENKEMEQKIKKKEIAPPEDQAVQFEKDELLPQADQKPPIEGYQNKNTGDYAQRAGGFIDPSTGIYIEPERSAKLSRHENVYEGKAIGKVDLTTGQYKAPRGLELDAQYGFITDRKAIGKMSKVKKKIFKEKAKRLNRGLAVQVKLPKKFFITDLPKWAYTKEELWERDQLTFSYYPYSQSFKTSGSVNGDPEKKFGTESAHYLGILWTQANGSKWRLVSGFAFKQIDYKDDSFLSEKNSSRYSKLSIGILTDFYPNWTISPRLELDQNPYLGIEGASGNTYDRKLIRVTVPKLRVHFKGQYHNWKNWTFEPSLAPSISFAKSFGKMRADPAFGLLGKIGFNYWLKSNHSLEGGVWFSLDTGKVNGAGGDYRIKREESGLLFRYNWIL